MECVWPMDGSTDVPEADERACEAVLESRNVRGARRGRSVLRDPYDEAGATMAVATSAAVAGDRWGRF